MLKYLSGVATLRLDPEACIGCGICTQVCPHGVFLIQAGRASIIELDRCIECGACALNCPVDALTVRAGVGCATGILLSALGRTGGDCCCSPQGCGTRAGEIQK